MLKMYANSKSRETLAKEYRTYFNSRGIPARLEPKLYLIADTDELQKQVNRLEKHQIRIDRIRAAKSWKNAK